MKVKIVKGKDTLCKKCPNNGGNGTVCNETFLKILDEKVKNLVKLENNITYQFDEILAKIKKILNSQKHRELCGECHWRDYGLCKDTFKKVKSTQ